MHAYHCYVCGPECEGAPRTYDVTYTRGAWTLHRAIGVCARWTTERAHQEVRAVMAELRALAEGADDAAH